MTGIAMRSHELPLLGSNQDSPDPESGEHQPLDAGIYGTSRGNTPETRPNHHENPHDPPHTGYALLARGADLVGQYVIYGLVDPREPQRVRYVGKSASPFGRLLSHITGQSGGGEMLGEWIAELRLAGRVPDMVLLERVRPGAYARERAWYEHLRIVGQADRNGNSPHRRHDFPDDPRPVSAAERKEIEAAESARAAKEYWQEVFANSQRPGWREDAVSPLVLDELARQNIERSRVSSGSGQR